MVRMLLFFGGGGTVATPIVAPFLATASAASCVVVAIILVADVDWVANNKREREIGPSQPHGFSDSSTTLRRSLLAPVVTLNYCTSSERLEVEALAIAPAPIP